MTSHRINHDKVIGVISGGLFINDKSLDASGYYNLMTFGPETQKGSHS
jgi:hypothetical protein